MNIQGIEYDSMLNGDGIRAVVWVSGCNHACSGCQNPKTHDPDSGRKITTTDLHELIKYISKDYVSGVTFSGGDPLYPANRREVGLIASILKYASPKKTIWLYTGYLWKEINTLPLLANIDVLVDGPYIASLRDNQYHWAGSTNQRVIDVQRSLARGFVVLHEDALKIQTPL